MKRLGAKNTEKGIIIIDDPLSDHVFTDVGKQKIKALMAKRIGKVKALMAKRIGKADEPLRTTD